MDKNKNTRLLRTGIIGTVIVAVCCFTPALVILLTMMGLSAAIGYLDYLLFPALALFLALSGYAAVRKRSLSPNQACCEIHHKDGENR